MQWRSWGKCLGEGKKEIFIFEPLCLFCLRLKEGKIKLVCLLPESLLPHPPPPHPPNLPQPPCPKEVLRLTSLLPSSFAPTAWGSQAGQPRVHNRNEMDEKSGIQVEPPSTALGVWPTSPAPGWALGEEGWTPVSFLPSHIEMTLQRKKGSWKLELGSSGPPN